MSFMAGRCGLEEWQIDDAGFGHVLLAEGNRLDGEELEVDGLVLGEFFHHPSPLTQNGYHPDADNPSNNKNLHTYLAAP
jgi:hypothetical protein